MAEGWAFPELGRKEHYFVNGRSLCGRWAYLADVKPDDGHRCSLTCVPCTRALDVKENSGG